MSLHSARQGLAQAFGVVRLLCHRPGSKTFFKPTAMATYKNYGPDRNQTLNTATINNNEYKFECECDYDYDSCICLLSWPANGK